MSKTWNWVKNGLIAIGLFIAGFFLIKKGTDTSGLSLDPKGKAKEDSLSAKAELQKVKKARMINQQADERKKKAAEDLKKKSKKSKVKPKNKKESLKNSQKKTQKRSQNSSRRGSR